MIEIVHFPGQSAYCAYDSGKLVGRVTYSRSSDAITVTIIDVHKGYRRGGIATALLEHVYNDNPGVKMRSYCLTDDGRALYYGLRARDPRAKRAVVSVGHMVGTGFV